MEINTGQQEQVILPKESSENTAQLTPETAEQFLLKALQLVADSQGDPQQVYPVWITQQNQFTAELLTVLPQVGKQLFAQYPKQKSEIASVLGDFANLLCQFPSGTRWLNVELAVEAYQLVLEARAEAFPPDWTMTQNNLANAYRDRIRGERADNLEKAIEACQLALQVRTRKTFAPDWAMTQNNLATIYSDRILGERADNLEKAIDALKLALQVYTQQTFPQEWATIQNNLGNAYSNRILGERADNLEKAIKAYQLALRVRTREAFPEDWAMTQNNLAGAYSDRIRGERADNLEKAIEAYQLALQVYARETFPQQWAMTQNNLATACGENILGEWADNLERAINSFKLALQVYTREAFPQDWAMTQGNLAQALFNRAELNDTPADLDTAIQLLHEALEVVAPGSSNFISSQYRLGKALFRRYEQRQQRADLEQAVQAYETAFRTLDPEHYDLPFYRERVGEVQAALGGLLVNEGKWRQGLEFLHSGLENLQQTDNLPAHASALYQAGRAQELLSNIETAGVYYRDALRLYQHLDDQSGIARTRERLGSLLVGQGYLEPGIEHLKAAQQLYRELDQPEQAANLDELLQAAQTILEKQSDSIATP